MWKSKKSFEEKELDSFIQEDKEESAKKQLPDAARISEETQDVVDEVSSVVIPIASINFKKLQQEKREENK